MQILTTIAGTRAASRLLRQNGPIAFVPTMGALHAGHLSLVAHARTLCPTVAASIFVNPLQFGPNEDFDRYPRTLARDAAMLEAAGVDLLFAPSVAELVPTSSATTVDPGPLASLLDGAARPGHFRGVATIVTKLFHILQPEIACFGQKDAVQLAILRQLVRDLCLPTQIVACPIIRDPDGLALSSRNAYLTPAERETALALPRALALVQNSLANGTRLAALALAPAHAILTADANLALEYLVAVHPETLLTVTEITPGTLVAVAARVGKTRLIDNFLARNQ